MYTLHDTDTKLIQYYIHISIQIQKGYNNVYITRYIYKRDVSTTIVQIVIPA